MEIAAGSSLFGPKGLAALMSLLRKCTAIELARRLEIKLQQREK